MVVSQEILSLGNFVACDRISKEISPSPSPSPSSPSLALTLTLAPALTLALVRQIILVYSVAHLNGATEFPRKFCRRDRISKEISPSPSPSSPSLALTLTLALTLALARQIILVYSVAHLNGATEFPRKFCRRDRISGR